MKSLVFSPTIIVIFFVLQGFSYPFNQIPFGPSVLEWHKYPDRCCQLEWKNISRGEPLPDDAVIGGTFNGKKYGYTRSSKPSIALKSEDPQKEPEYFQWTGNSIYPWPILVNPNKCIINWYPTKKFKEQKEQNDHWFFPNADYHEYGSFAKIGNRPGRVAGHIGNVAGQFNELSGSGHKFTRYDSGIEMMYVNCLASQLQTTSEATMKVLFNPYEFQRVRFRPDIFHNDSRKTIYYYSDDHEVMSVNFTIIRNNNASIRFDEIPRIPLNVTLKDSAFSDFFAARGLLIDLEKVMYEAERAQEEAQVQIVTKKLEQISKNVQLHSQEKIELMSYSKAYRGLMRFRAVYEVTPTGSTSLKQLEDSLKDFISADRVSNTTDGKLTFSYSGSIEYQLEDMHVRVKNSELTRLTESMFNNVKILPNCALIHEKLQPVEADGQRTTTSTP